MNGTKGPLKLVFLIYLVGQDCFSPAGLIRCVGDIVFGLRAQVGVSYAFSRMSLLAPVTQDRSDLVDRNKSNIYRSMLSPGWTACLLVGLGKAWRVSNVDGGDSNESSQKAEYTRKKLVF